MAHSLSKNNSNSLPMIHVQSFTPSYFAADSSLLNTELRRLMLQVAELRKDTETIVCSCSDPECPFNCTTEAEDNETDSFCGMEKESPDLGFGSMEFIPHSKKQNLSNRHSYPIQLKSPPTSHKRPLGHSESASLTNISRVALQKRADGTILEKDYPGFHRAERNKKYTLGGGYSLSHLNQLDVTFDEQQPDCLVDQDGLTSNHDYLFSRKAPERKLVRNSAPQMRLSRNARWEHNNSRTSVAQPDLERRVSDGPFSIMRHSSDGVCRQESAPVRADLRLMNFRNISKRHTIIA